MEQYVQLDLLHTKEFGLNTNPNLIAIFTTENIFGLTFQYVESVQAYGMTMV